MTPNAPVFDLQARRTARPRDARVIIDNLADGTELLCAMFSGWPMTYLRASHLKSAETTMDALQALLAELRTHVAPDGAA